MKREKEMTKDSVCVVTVTYGDRWEFLEKVIKAVVSYHNVLEIIVIDNASKFKIEEKCKEISEKINVIRFERNTGSAIGFNKGIEIACTGNAEFIWLLDDDNMPEEQGVNYLVNNYRKIENETGVNGGLALLSLREDRKEYVMSAEKGNAFPFFPKENSFLGVHFKDITYKVFKKITSHLKRNTAEKSLKKNLSTVKVPVAPYGGLFFQKDLIKEIGLPNKDFYLYADDHEFSYRITRFKKGIFLIPDSKIIDLEKSWFLAKNQGFLLSLIHSQSSFRIYYSVRNRIYFERKDLVTNKFIYNINKFLFLFILNSLSLIFKKKQRRELIISAIQDAESNRMGVNDLYTLK